eukprot:scaffold17348_cov36-Phaeocystis_antarctica.AAC.1
MRRRRAGAQYREHHLRQLGCEQQRRHRIRVARRLRLAPLEPAQHRHLVSRCALVNLPRRVGCGLGEHGLLGLLDALGITRRRAAAWPRVERADLGGALLACTVLLRLLPWLAAALDLLLPRGHFLGHHVDQQGLEVLVEALGEERGNLLFYEEVRRRVRCLGHVPHQLAHRVVQRHHLLVPLEAQLPLHLRRLGSGQHCAPAVRETRLEQRVYHLRGSGLGVGLGPPGSGQGSQRVRVGVRVRVSSQWEGEVGVGQWEGEVGVGL